MSLSDLLAKAPTPVPPSTEPWPRPVSKREGFSQSKSSYKDSSLYSATARPTLEEFLRTNYLLIPEFISQVTRTKLAVKRAEGREDSKTASSSSLPKVLDETAKHEGTLSPASVDARNKLDGYKPELSAGSNRKRRKVQEDTGSAGMVPLPSVDVIIQGTSNPEKLMPQVKPKPRMTAMKGATSTTFPFSQPKENVSFQGTVMSGKNSSQSVHAGSRDGRRNLLDKNTDRLEEERHSPKQSKDGVSCQIFSSESDKKQTFTGPKVVSSHQKEVESVKVEKSQDIPNSHIPSSIPPLVTTNKVQVKSKNTVEIGNPRTEADKEQSGSQIEKGGSHTDVGDHVEEASAPKRRLTKNDWNSLSARRHSPGKAELDTFKVREHLPDNDNSKKEEAKFPATVTCMPDTGIAVHARLPQPVFKRPARRELYTRLRSSSTPVPKKRKNNVECSLSENEFEGRESLPCTRYSKKTTEFLRDERIGENLSSPIQDISMKTENAMFRKNSDNGKTSINVAEPLQDGKSLELPPNKELSVGVMGDQKVVSTDCLADSKLHQDETNMKSHSILGPKTFGENGVSLKSKECINGNKLEDPGRDQSAFVLQGPSRDKDQNLGRSSEECYITDPKGLLNERESDSLSKEHIKTQQDPSCCVSHENFEDLFVQPPSTDNSNSDQQQVVGKKAESGTAKLRESSFYDITTQGFKAAAKKLVDTIESTDTNLVRKDHNESQKHLLRDSNDIQENVYEQVIDQKGADRYNNHQGYDNNNDDDYSGDSNSDTMQNVDIDNLGHTAGNTGTTEDVVEESYAELVMKDSDSDQEIDDECNSDLDNNSDEGEEVKSDYESEEMALESDPDLSTGGIISCRDPLSKSQKNKASRLRRKVRQKAKNQRKKESKQRAKARKQTSQGNCKTTGSRDARRSRRIQEIQKTIEWKKPGAIGDSKNYQGTGDVKKSTSSSSMPKTQASQDKPQPVVTSEGSLLSLVTACALDVTVAASEKLALKKTRGGQHAKKLKKAKRRAEALERIRRGDPHPRPRRVHIEVPKPLCTFYVEGKCRKGSECPFRHDKSARVKKKEMCKFYANNSCLEGTDCMFMHSSFPCKFFHTSRCWEGDRCKFSHNALTAETERLLQSVLNPPKGERVLQDKPDSSPVGSPRETQGSFIRLDTSASSKQWGSHSSGSGDCAVAASPYNLRASTVKRRLSAEGTNGSSRLIGCKVSKHVCSETDKDEVSHTKNNPHDARFVSGFYKDLSV